MRRFIVYLSARLSISLFWLLSYLPYPWVARLGEILGSIAFALPSSRKHIVLTNLRLCFPDWSEEKIIDTARQVFRYVIRSFAERGMLWLGSTSRLRKWVYIDDQAQIAQFKNKPHILLGMHTVGIEAGDLRLSCYLAELGLGGGAMLYTPMRNNYFDAFVKRARERFGATLLPRANQIHLLRRLIREGVGVQIAPDMDFGINNSAFVDFFGVSACTLTVVSRLARITHAQVIPTITELLPNYRGYVLRILPPWSNYPSDDAISDSRRMNMFFESYITNDPAQYYWVHRRFKTRPKGESSLY